MSPQSKSEFFQEVKLNIFEIYIKMNARPGHCFEEKFNLFINYGCDLNPKQNQWLPEAIKSVIDEGYVSRGFRAGKDVLILTEKGFNVIY